MPTDGYVFVGLVGMIDPPRPEVPEALANCRTAGIKVAMLTGDFGLTAVTIARQIGLVTGEGKVVQGDELAAMSGDELAAVLRAHNEIVLRRIAPAQKLQVVQAFQALGEIVTVTGDGVNDAPALKNADMGVAMGVMGTDVAKEASNMVLMDDNFATIVNAVEEGRTIFENIKKFIAYILTSNIPQITPLHRLRPARHPIAADGRADPVHRSRHRPATGARARRGATRDGCHEKEAAGPEGKAAFPQPPADELRRCRHDPGGGGLFQLTS